MAICNNKKCSIGECDQSEICTAYVPVITNADRIRSMTDRELADLFYGIRECNVCAYNYEGRCERCSDGIFKWLQKPVEKPKEDA